MGPTALFDKSFLQSLSFDESVLFDCNLHQNRVTRAALQNPESVKRINRFMEAPALPPEQVDWEPGEA